MHIGIDLGGTKTEVAVINVRGEFVYRKRRPSPQGSYKDTLDFLHNFILSAESETTSHCTVGLGIPGTISPDTGLIKNANSTWLIGHPLAADLSEKLSRPVTIANDADCFTLSEAKDGAGKHYRSVFGVILGTGVGGGLYYNHQLISGPNAIAGEWGHNPLPWAKQEELPGPPCYCGKLGCIETWLSGPALQREFQLTTQQALSVAEYLVQKTPEINDCLTVYIDRLSKSLASVINIFDPEVIVLGGGLSNIDELYSDTQEKLKHYVFSDQVNTRILKNKHGDSSGVRGAAWLGAT